MKKLVFIVLICLSFSSCMSEKKPQLTDTTPPQINVQEKFCIVDSLDEISVTDDSGEAVNLELHTEESLFPLCHIAYIKATDSSGNSTEKTMCYLLNDDVENVRTTRTGHHCYTIDGVSYVDGYVIANKSFSLPASYGNGIVPQAQQAFEKMQAAAEFDGVDIWMRSGYRSYDYQNTLFTNYANRDGIAARETYSARPGYSEHQTGLAMDLNSLDQSFENTVEFRWLNENAYKYGFILRYVKYKEDQTGYIYEPWHYRYVGTELSEILYNNGDWMTMEEYFGVDSHY